MKVKYEKPSERDPSLIGRLEGAFNEAGSAMFWESVSQLADEDNRYVVLDLTGVTVLTSTALGTLVRLHSRLRVLDGGLALFGCNPKIREMIEIVMLAEILKLSDSEAEAWQALGV